jgi:hypothetical protein
LACARYEERKSGKVLPIHFRLNIFIDGIGLILENMIRGRRYAD